MSFNHENLQVYQRTLSFCAKVGIWTGQWDGRHANADQFSRAAGSMLENIAMASAAYSTMKLRCLDYAIGSSLECAACLDLARVKRLMDGDTVYAEKEGLAHILRMLAGLRKSWGDGDGSVREDCGQYGVHDKACDKVQDEVQDKAQDKAQDKVQDKAQDKVQDKVQNRAQDKVQDKVQDKAGDEGNTGNPLFHHEALEVYRVALAAAGVIYSSQLFSDLPTPVFRRLDELITGMVLNIAEGNGRFSDADQARFLRTSHESVIKLAARLDLCCARGLLPRNETDEFKCLLEKVAVITWGMMRSVRSKGGQSS